jgi:glycine/D-amino acid oxidase-like deaminating enzyme
VPGAARAVSRGLYHPSVYDPAPVASYWEAAAPRDPHAYHPLAGDAACDVAVIGGGYTGLSAALHLARDHATDVRLLEAGPIGWGASGRNGGFCCLPATKLSVQQMVARYGLDETKRFFAAQLEGMEVTAALADDEGFEVERVGDGNLEVAHSPGRLDDLKAYGEALSGLFGIRTRMLDRAAFAEIAHDSTEQFGGLHMGAGYALHPLKLALGLGAAAARRGAVLHPGSRVEGWQRDGAWHRLATAGGTLKARRVVLATNGFTSEGLHPVLDGRLLPALSNIVVTRPLSDAELAAHGYKTVTPVINTRALLFYYRLLPDRRFLFGARGDMTGTPLAGRRIRAWLERRLCEVFPRWRGVETEYFWRGLVCLTRKLTPSVGRLADDPTVFYGFGFHANGVNTAPWTGRLLAGLVAGRASEADVPAVMRGLPQRFPLPALRLWYLRGAYALSRWKDAR